MLDGVRISPGLFQCGGFTLTLTSDRTRPRTANLHLGTRSHPFNLEGSVYQPHLLDSSNLSFEMFPVGFLLAHLLPRQTRASSRLVLAC